MKIFEVQLLPGDIFLTRGAKIKSKAIRLFTRTFGEKRTKVNHAGFITSQATVLFASCIEALEKIVEHDFWEQYAVEDQEVAVYRVKKWNDSRRSRCVEHARLYKGYEYGYLALGCHLLDWALQGAYVFRRLTNSENYPICSWLVDCVCSKLGVSFGVPTGSANPDDIWDYIQAHPEEFEEILPLGRLGN